MPTPSVDGGRCSCHRILTKEGEPLKGDWSSSWLQSSFWSAAFTQLKKFVSNLRRRPRPVAYSPAKICRETMQPLSSAPALDQGLDGFLPRATSWNGSYRFDHSSLCFAAVLFIGLIDTLITTMIRITGPHQRLRD